jgi:hypothetical protein
VRCFEPTCFARPNNATESSGRTSNACPLSSIPPPPCLRPPASRAPEWPWQGWRHRGPVPPRDPLPTRVRHRSRGGREGKASGNTHSQTREGECVSWEGAGSATPPPPHYPMSHCDSGRLRVVFASDAPSSSPPASLAITGRTGKHLRFTPPLPSHPRPFVLRRPPPRREVSLSLPPRDSRDQVPGGWIAKGVGEGVDGGGGGRVITPAALLRTTGSVLVKRFLPSPPSIPSLHFRRPPHLTLTTFRANRASLIQSQIARLDKISCHFSPYLEHYKRIQR